MSTEGDALEGTFHGSINRRPSGSWRWRVSVDGRRHARTWTTDDVAREAHDGEAEKETVKRLARREYVELEARYARGGETDAPFSRLLALYRQRELPKKAEATRAGYSYDLDAAELFFCERGDDPRVSEMGRGDVRAFLAWRACHKPDGAERDEPLSAVAVKRAKAVLSVVFAEAVEAEWIGSNPAKAVKVDTPDREYVILSAEEYERLLEAADGHPMFRMYLLLGGEAGLRRGEALDLRWSDLALEAGFLSVVSGRDGRRTKGGRSRSVPLTGRLRAALRRHVLQFRGRTYHGARSPYVIHHPRDRNNVRAGQPYTRFRHALDKAREAAELPREWRFHDLRHRRVTEWLRAGHSPVLVKKAAGHAKLSTTMSYEHLVRRDLESMVGEEDPERATLSNMVG